jgi:hypothetical protein
MIALSAPGLDGWENSRSVLCGAQDLQLDDVKKYKPSRLPPNEQRRASDTVRMAFRIGEEIAQAVSDDLAGCASVFASSGGDYAIIHQICETLCSDEKMISPTRFHNSVHNAPSGYWAIATGSHQASISLSAYDDTFISALVEAMAMVEVEHNKVLLVAYDIKPPFPLGEARKITHPFATGMLLAPVKSGNSLYEIQLNFSSEYGKPRGRTLPVIPPLTELFYSNPIARSIPLLEVIAGGNKGQVVYFWENSEDSNPITVELAPC